MDKLANPCKKPLTGQVIIPSDKSISHRSAIFAALTGGKVEITNYSQGADCQSTLKVLEELGVDIKRISKGYVIINNKNGFQKPSKTLDAGNSGTTIRLMAGILASQDFDCAITGDESLCKRPMGRIINPLALMGANIAGKDNKAPLTIKGKKLKGIDYFSLITSAQVKSAILLAGLNAEGITTVEEPYKSRDHSERMLQYLGANISIEGNKVSISSSNLVPKSLSIPGDISSAAFFMVAGTIIPNSDIIIKNIGLNPTRTGIIDVLKQMGADIEILDKKIECGEEVGDVRVKYSELKGISIEGEVIPRIIDEIPIIAVAATQAQGTTIIKDASDLRNKESDRISAVYNELKKLGANIKETPDGFIIEGKTQLKGGCTINTYHDHRIAMSAYIASLIADSPVQINDFEWVNISFPEFEELINSLIK